jgi:hypothetical protein
MKKRIRKKDNFKIILKTYYVFFVHAIKLQANYCVHIHIVKAYM